MTTFSLNQLRDSQPFLNIVFQSINMAYLPIYLRLLKHHLVKFYTFIQKVFASVIIFVTTYFFLLF